MDQEKLRPLIDAVKKNPQDSWAWMQLGSVAKMTNDWQTAYCSYLTATRLCPDNKECLERFSQAREEYIKFKEIPQEEFYQEISKLPHHTVVILLIGMLNTVIDPLINEVKNAVAKGCTKVVFDFTGMFYISGLGPSCLRNLLEHITKQNGKMAIVGQKPDIRHILELKKVLITEYVDIAEAFLKM